MPTLLYLVCLLITVYQHTQFAYQDFSDTENKDKRSNEDLNFHCDLDLEHNHPLYTQETPEYDDVPSNQIWLQKEQTSSKDMVEAVMCDHEPSL